MAHTYIPITIGDRTFTPVSDITPSGTVEDKFTWVNTYPNQDTWLELSVNGGKVHWCDWYYGTAWTDAFTSLTTPDKTYSSVTKSDRTYSSVTTPSATYKGVTK